MASDTPPAVSWLHAFPPILLLASSAMAQPAGRLLDTPTVYSVLLRASPIMCALDALVLAVQCLAYCIALRATPRQVLLLIGTDRFVDESENGDKKEGQKPEDQNTTAKIWRTAGVLMAVTATATRLAVFFLGVLALVEVVAFEPGGGEVRWTAAWGWMFVGAYLLVEAALQVYRRELSKPQHTPADFELEDVSDLSVDGDSDDNFSNGRLCASRVDGSTRGEPSAEMEALLARDNDDGDVEPVDNDRDYDGSTLGPASRRPSTVGVSASCVSDRDIEASVIPHSPGRKDPDNARHPYEYNDDLTNHAQLPALRNGLQRLQTYGYMCGCILHAGLLYWAFLDLVQIPINQHVLAVDFSNTTAEWEIATGWGEPLSFFGYIFICLAFLMGIVLCLGPGALILFAFFGIGQIVTQKLPPPPSDKANDWPKMAVMVPACILGGGLGFGSSAYLVSMLFAALETPYMFWFWEMLAFECMVFLLFFSGCMLLYVCLLLAAGMVKAFIREVPGRHTLQQQDQPPKERGGLRYLESDTLAWVSAVLVTLVLSVVWYKLRFADSARWVQNWRDALVATATTTTTMANSASNATGIPTPISLEAILLSTTTTGLD